MIFRTVYSHSHILSTDCGNLAMVTSQACSPQIYHTVITLQILGRVKGRGGGRQ